MSTELSVIRPKILSEILAIVQQNNLTGEIDLGKLVLFLETELLTKLDDRILNLKLLWKFCQKHTELSRDQFVEVFQPLKDKFADDDLMVVIPRLPRRSAVANANSMDPQVLQLLQQLLVVMMECVTNSPLRELVSMEQLDEILVDHVADFHVSEIIDLDPIWDEFLKIPGVFPDILEPVCKQLHDREKDFPYEVLLPEVMLAKAPSVDVSQLRAQFQAQGMTPDMIEQVISTVQEKEEEKVQERVARRVASRAAIPAISNTPGGATPEVTRIVLVEILDCVSHTEIEKIIDPDKLQGFLQDELSDMWENEAFNLQPLWDILLDAPGVTEEMLMQTFLLLESKRETLPVKVWVPAEVRELSPEAKRALMPNTDKKAAQVPGPQSDFSSNHMIGSRSGSAAKMASISSGQNAYLDSLSGSANASRSGAAAPRARRSTSASRVSGSASRVSGASSRVSGSASRVRKSTLGGKSGAAKSVKGKKKGQVPMDKGGNPKQKIILGVLIGVLALVFMMFWSGGGESYSGTLIDSVPYKLKFVAEMRVTSKKRVMIKLKRIFNDLPPDKRQQVFQKIATKVFDERSTSSISFFDADLNFIESFN